METIIYIMHIDWNWIKQRPQFIAEGLSNKYKIEVFYKYSFKRRNYQKRKNIIKNITLNKIVSIPGRFEKYKFIKK